MIVRKRVVRFALKKKVGKLKVVVLTMRAKVGVRMRVEKKVQEMRVMRASQSIV